MANLSSAVLLQSILAFSLTRNVVSFTLSAFCTRRCGLPGRSSIASMLIYVVPCHFPCFYVHTMLLCLLLLVMHVNSGASIASPRLCASCAIS